MTKDWPGGSYLLLNSMPMVHGDISRIAIGYKYNYQKVLYFFTTEMSGRTKSYITYLSKYHYQFANVVIQPVVFPHIDVLLQRYIRPRAR